MLFFKKSIGNIKPDAMLGGYFDNMLLGIPIGSPLKPLPFAVQDIDYTGTAQNIKCIKYDYLFNICEEVLQQNGLISLAGNMFVCDGLTDYQTELTNGFYKIEFDNTITTFQSEFFKVETVKKVQL